MMTAGGRPPAGGNGLDPPNGTPNGITLAVVLTVSNPSPNVGEEVILQCRVVEGDPTGATFSFQPTNLSLITDERRGTARLVIDASFAGSELGFTCTASNGSDTSSPSNRQTIIVQPLPEP